MRLTLLLVVPAFALPLAAQRTFVVDAANGAGTHFTDLPPALAQSQHGDVFVVRSGTYSPASTDKGVALLGSAGVRIDGGATPTPPLVVANLPAGQTFAAKLIELTSLGGPGLQLLNCQGRVHLVGVRATSLLGTESITIDQCREVTMNNVQSQPAVLVSATTLVITGSAMNGRNAGFTPQRSTTALALAQSEVLIADSVLRGGDGLIGFGSAQSPSSAINARDSEVTLAATAAGRTSVTAGFCRGGFCNSFTTVSACALNDATARYSAAVTFVTQFPSVPPFWLSGTAQAIQAPVPALIASGSSLGGTLTTTLASSPNDPIWLVLALPADPVRIPAGTLFVDLTAYAVLALTLQGPSGTTTLSLPVPNNPLLHGRALTLQGAAYVTATQTLFFSNPVVAVFS